MFGNLKKNMPRLFVLLAVAMFLSGSMVASALALHFENSPETNAPEWETPYPYQRNIYWDFATNPEGGPGSGGAPGAEYTGDFDDALKVYDSVQFTGDAGYSSTNQRIGASGNGSYGTATFHLGNMIRDWPIKHIWIEGTYDTHGNGKIFVSLNLPDGSVVTDSVLSGHNGTNDNDWFRIELNPAWEEIVFTFDVTGGGGRAWMNELHIATECVPIPGTLLLMGSGLVGLIGVGRKKLFKRG